MGEQFLLFGQDLLTGPAQIPVNGCDLAADHPQFVIGEFHIFRSFITASQADGEIFQFGDGFSGSPGDEHQYDSEYDK
jgi:hypothetical protein